MVLKDIAIQFKRIKIIQVVVRYIVVYLIIIIQVEKEIHIRKYQKQVILLLNLIGFQIE